MRYMEWNEDVQFRNVSLLLFLVAAVHSLPKHNTSGDDGMTTYLGKQLFGCLLSLHPSHHSIKT
jgi:hypothetical protein